MPKSEAKFKKLIFLVLILVKWIHYVLRKKWQKHKQMVKITLFIMF